ncbi:putative transmembrane protein 1g [SARS coronavirus ZJ0301]|uniref:Putative transmembrane protein 1g n=2 Tax=Severe acute respiratory syndrome coronavirus TaxID=694009 RepID=Q3S2D8_SARS|nr:putative transmembrane protein 1g [SARS coronavirus ZJ01]ABA02254.1 putative transmembrane protein 1g [SARS coronavirus ZJ0301]
MVTSCIFYLVFLVLLATFATHLPNSLSIVILLPLLAFLLLSVQFLRMLWANLCHIVMTLIC